MVLLFGDDGYQKNTEIYLVNKIILSFISSLCKFFCLHRQRGLCGSGSLATNIQGDAQFGYMLVWVIVGSNLMAMLIQALSAKLGIANGKNLAEQCLENFPRPVAYTMWVLIEQVAIATDLAKFLGAAIGYQLLLDIPLFAGAVLTAIATLLILALERFASGRWRQSSLQWLGCSPSAI